MTPKKRIIKTREEVVVYGDASEEKLAQADEIAFVGDDDEDGELDDEQLDNDDED